MEGRITDIHCPQCGAPADFDIIRQTYLCAHCGEHVEIGEAVKEIRGFRKIRADHLEKTVRSLRLFRASCTGCGAEVVFEENEAASVCAFCGRKLVRTEYLSARDMPEGVIPFAVSQDEAKRLLKQWCHNNPLKKEAGLLEKKDPMGSPVMSLDAFVLKRGKKVLNVVLGDAESLKSFKEILTDALEVVGKYDMKKGWFGAETLIQSVTCTPGDPVDVMGLGMNEGNSWFIFSGYCDFLMRDKLAGWVKEIGDPVVTDVGYAPIFGCNDWSSMQVQMMKTAEDWTNFQKAYGGYIFRDVPEGGLGTGPECDAFFATPGNARQINTWGKPFAIRTGSVLGGLTNSMVLFVKKGEKFDKEKMWEAIMSCNSVAIADQGVIMGPDMFRKSAQLLALDRIYLEDYFGDRINMESFIEGHTLNVKVTNHSLNR